MAGGLIWLLAVLCALPATRLRYVRAAGRDRERMQWLGTGVVVAATVALVSAVLHLLVGWPESAGAVAASAAVVVPLAVIAGGMAAARAGTAGGVLVQVLSAAGSAAVVAVIYLVIVLGLGRGARRRRRPQAARALHARGRAGGDRVPCRPGGAWPPSPPGSCTAPGRRPTRSLRTFGSRLTRAIAMDELLLQLAESLRKTMRAGQRRGLHRRGRRAGAHGVGPGRGPQVDRADRPGAAGRDPGRGVGERVGRRSGCPRCSTGANRLSCGSRRSATRASCSASSWSSGPPARTPSPTRTTAC